MIVVPVVLFLIMAIGLNKNLISQEADARKEKIYEVTSFVAKDTLPPLTADTLRWKRVLLFVYVNNMVIYDMKDQQHWYQFDVDSSKKNFILHDDPKMGDWKIFHYNYLSKDQLQLTGKWKGNDINATMQIGRAHV